MITLLVISCLMKLGLLLLKMMKEKGKMFVTHDAMPSSSAPSPVLEMTLENSKEGCIMCYSPDVLAALGMWMYLWSSNCFPIRVL